MAARRPPRLSLLPRPSPLSRVLKFRPRFVHIRATPSTQTIDGVVDLSDQTQAIPKLSAEGPFPAEVQFEVLGAPYSLLSVALPASSVLYSRRGTLVGLNGKVQNATSTLSILEPIRRSLLGIPFIYQKTTSASPLTLLLSTNTPNTTFGVLQLDGKADWAICQRSALLAWTGHSLSIHPSFSPRMSLAHWGTSRITGRGLVGLIGKGQIYQATLKPGETFVVHPSALLAYSITNENRKPTPYRIAAMGTRLRLQIPGVVTSWWKQLEPVKFVRNSEAWQTMARAVWAVRSWVRRTVWGDRLFLRFEGPATILIQSRTSQLRDIITREDVDELAAVQPGAAASAVEATTVTPATAITATAFTDSPAAVPAPSPAPQPSILSSSEGPIKVEGVNSIPFGVGTPGGKTIATSGEVLRRVVVTNGKVEFQDSDFSEFRPQQVRK
ncbi:hypothetical protein EX30DRAFT_341755 [Ascodesmis nigricans]|uniref:Altered inheritance of mitochondria protein 24, mitochondrial n=1 Tax=Ascodesmis nigricans TaxID=341454 RepID=A0A4S2MUM6_9PEZI|nr:hypothetical protein EX30DRAFT_341755 [Ascodesmis nigricans]